MHKYNFDFLISILYEYAIQPILQKLYIVTSNEYCIDLFIVFTYLSIYFALKFV
jgi:hypothetical protein